MKMSITCASGCSWVSSMGPIIVFFRSSGLDRLGARERSQTMKKLLALAVASILTSSLRAAETDRTIPMPKEDQEVKIDFSSDKAKIVSLRIQHYPDAGDIEKARTKDLNDKHLTFWNFSVANRNLDKKVKMRMAVEVIGK